MHAVWFAFIVVSAVIWPTHQSHSDDGHPCEWKTYTDSFIVNNDKATYKDIPLDDCKKLCDDEHSFTCNSIDYNHESRMCTLSDVTFAQAASNHKVRPSTSWSILECVTSGSDQPRCGWEIHSGSFVVSNDNAVYKDIPLDQCKTFCDEEKSFTCNSLDYNHDTSLCTNSEITFAEATTIHKVRPSTSWSFLECVAPTPAPDMKDKVEDVKKEVEDEIEKDKEMAKEVKDQIPKQRNQPYKWVQRFLVGTPYAKILSYPDAILEKLYTEYLKNNGDKLRADEIKPLHPTGSDKIIDTCPFQLRECSNNQTYYRSFDGSCNNLKKPMNGRAFIPFKRYLPPAYGDGVKSLTRSRNGSALPSARLVSYFITTLLDEESEVESLLHMTWGQFMDHDMDLTAVAKIPQEGTDETLDVVCGDSGCDENVKHCSPIQVEENDPNFSSKKCLTFVRSEGVPNRICSLGPRQQLNQISSWLDGSNVYGSTKERADSIRDQSDSKRGRMLTTPHPINSKLKDLLPRDFNATCKQTTEVIKCFKAGDVRANEQNHLTVTHTVMVREHNRIEEQLHKLNPHWDGDTLYHETRKIIGAILQRVSYKEYLGAMFSRNQMNKFGLTMLEEGYYKGYDSSVDGSIANVFAASAFRFGHSQIPSFLLRPDAKYNPHGFPLMPMSSTLFTPKGMYDTKNDGIDSIIRGLAKQKSNVPDQYMTPQMHAHLFTDHAPTGLGTDLGSLNIQRGRDHGLPGYNKWRVFCGLKALKSFTDLIGQFRDDGTVETMSKIYSHVDDIDLFPAALAEKPEEAGALVGPTFSCLIGKQFSEVRKGDRFWHENEGPEGFTKDQLQEIRKVTLAKLYCRNGDNVNMIQKEMMKIPSAFNPLTYCSSIPDMDLSKWKY